MFKASNVLNMAGIKHLSEEYDKKPDLIKRQLMKGCVITEKLDGTAFSAENYFGRLRFYKKDERNPISHIDRAMMKLYEEPISFFNLDKIPEGYRLCFEYFFDRCPVHVEYDRRPEPAGLCLTHAKEINDSGNVSRIVDGVDELKALAERAGVEGPPVVYDGQLTSEQVDSIVGFSKGVKDTPELFQSLGSKPTLNDDSSSYIEGFVVQEKSGALSDKLYKIVHPKFADMAKTRANSRDNGTLFEVVIDDFCDFVLKNGLERINNPQGETDSESYVDCMCKLFNLFVSENGERIKDADIRDARFSNKDAFSVNRDFIPNQKTKEFVNSHPSFEQMFRIFLGTFRKKRDRSNEVGTTRKSSINKTVGKVWKVARNRRSFGVPTFFDLEKQS